LKATNDISSLAMEINEKTRPNNSLITQRRLDRESLEKVGGE
jgi:hypothetical protein